MFLTVKVLMELRKIILVDSKKAFRESFKLLLRKVGGAEITAEFSSEKDFLAGLDSLCNADIVFLSIETDRFTSAETIKSALKKCPGTVIIGLSLHDEKAYADAIIQAGARGFLLKYSDNFSILETVMRYPKAEIFYSPEINPSGRAKHSDNIKIILTDDSNAALFISGHILKNEGFDVIPFLSATSALKFAAYSPPPQLIITDYIMPEISGTEFSKKIRRIPAYKNVPILMTTVRNDKTVIEEAQKNGVNLILKKPFTTKQLVSAVEKLLFEKKS